MISEGQFSCGGSGFWIEKGEFVFLAKELTISGSASELPNVIDIVGHDLDLNRTFTASTFRIKLMQIAEKRIEGKLAL